MTKTTPSHVSRAEFEKLFQAVNWGRWGPEDDKGTLNYISPEHVRRAAGLVRSGRSVSMEIPINTVAGPDNPRPATHYMVQNYDIHLISGSRSFARITWRPSFMAIAIPTSTRFVTSPIRESSITGSR